MWREKGIGHCDRERSKEDMLKWLEARAWHTGMDFYGFAWREVGACKSDFLFVLPRVAHEDVLRPRLGIGFGLWPLRQRRRAREYSLKARLIDAALPGWKRVRQLKSWIWMIQMLRARERAAGVVSSLMAKTVRLRGDWARMARVWSSMRSRVMVLRLGSAARVL
jgi:hypothetical protein